MKPLSKSILAILLLTATSASWGQTVIKVPEWDSQEWASGTFTTQLVNEGRQLADIRFAEQWGFMSGIRLTCESNKDNRSPDDREWPYLQALSKYFRAKGYPFVGLHVAYVYAQPQDIISSECETDEAKKWAILQRVIMSIWNEEGAKFAITEQLIEQIISEIQKDIDSGGVESQFFW